MGREPDHAAYFAEMIAFIKRRGKKLWTEDLRNEYNAIWEKYYGPMTPRGETPVKETPTGKATNDKVKQRPNVEALRETDVSEECP